MDYLITTILVLFSGLFSGLTLGLLGLDKAELKRKMNIGNEQARKVYSVRKHGNLLLCTLLLGNVAVNSTLSIFLGNIASGLVGGAIATGLIVIFGEIVPQATCSRYALLIGAKTVWIVRFFMFILLPVCWPIAWVLDKVLGEEMPTIWSRDELKEIIKLHENSNISEVNANEERIVLGALSYSEKTAGDIMTPRTMVFAFEQNTVLDEKNLNKIREGSFSRIPVYDKSLEDIKGLIYAKDLISVKAGTKVKDVFRKGDNIFITKEERLDNLMNKLIKHRKHLGFVYNKYGTFVGVVTLEDIIEEVLRVEIMDEDDKIVDLQKEALKRVKNLEVDAEERG